MSFSNFPGWKPRQKNDSWLVKVGTIPARPSDLQYPQPEYMEEFCNDDGHAELVAKVLQGDLLEEEPLDTKAWQQEKYWREPNAITDWYLKHPRAKKPAKLKLDF